MVTRKKASSKKSTAALSLKKDTIKSLDPVRKSANVKGGRIPGGTVGTITIVSAECTVTIVYCKKG
jgi:hypothetical protein